MVRVLGLHAVASGSNPVVTSGQDLFRLPGFNSTMPVGFLIIFLLSLN